MAPTNKEGAAIPTLIDCWRVRDLQRFRAVLKGGPAAAGLGTGQQGGGGGSGHHHQQLAAYSKSPPKSHGGGSYGSWGQFAKDLGPAPPAEVNRRDYFGRTALHLVATSEEGISIDFLHALLAHPSCNVNLQDTESGWTALHRALYKGNLNHALTLLRHSSIDVRIKDFEGLSAFDLYNSTVAGTNPPTRSPVEAAFAPVRGDLQVWGSNRNYTLGLGDGDDRAMPDLVNLRRSQGDEAYALPAGRKFDRIRVKEVQMSRMHTVVLTDEKIGNVWVAGIGSAGRLGRAASTQPVLIPLADFKETAVGLAVGPDHTLIITSNGSVYTFGSNKFGVLGYALEEGQGLVASSGTTGIGGAAQATFGQPAPTSSSGKNLDTQITPRKVVGPLKKEVVLGAAVSKLHSAVFTADSLYTWGSNTGQLGYDKAAASLQVIPRKVTSLTAAQTIQQVACSPHVTALLLHTSDVLVLHGDASFKLQFATNRFSEKMSAGIFRPPQAQPKPSIAKLTSSGNTFAALSEYGDLFTFSLDHPSEYLKSGASVGRRAPAPEPQLVWSVRKKFTAVRDVAIGADGSIILCTSSGHVFVRSRRSAGDVSKTSSKTGAARAFKFAQVPLLQRVVKVATNESGSFAAIRSQAPMRDIRIRGRTLEEDLCTVLPHLRVWSESRDGVEEAEGQITADIAPNSAAHNEQEEELARSVDSDDDEESSELGDSTIERHASLAMLIAEAARRWDRGEAQNHYGPDNLTPPLGCDMFLIAGGRYLPAHRAIVSARLPRLASLLENPPLKGSGGAPEGIVIKRPRPGVTTLVLPSCTFHTGLFLLHYLYTDDLPSVWTSSVGIKSDHALAAAKINRNTVQSQLKELASILALPALTPVLNSPVPRAPTPTLRTDLAAFFATAVDVEAEESLLRDVELELADRVVPAHSVVLQRSPFFATLFQPDWSAARWQYGILRVDMHNHRWDVVSIHLKNLYTDGAFDLFDGKDTERSQDEWLDWLTEVLAGSNELLMDRLKLVASSLIRARTAPQNIAALMSIADTYHAVPLKEASLLYCAQNLESLLESGMLDDLEHKMVRELSVFIKKRQEERMHRTRQSDFIAALIVKHQEYHDSLDIPPPSLNLVSAKVGKRPPRSPQAMPLERLTPAKSTRGGKRGGQMSASASPELRASNDSELFDMDEELQEALLASGEGVSPSLGAMAALSLRDQPPPMRLPRAVSGSSSAAAWSVVGKRGTSTTTAPTSNLDASVTHPASVASGSTPAENSLKVPPATQDLRSIMAAEQARSPAVYRRISSTQQTPSGSVPASGTATPTRAVPGMMGGSTSSASTVAGGGSSASASQNLPDLSQMSIGVRLSQKDRKKQQQQQQQQQVALAQANAAAAGAASQGEGELSTAPSTSRWGSTSSPWKVAESAPTSALVEPSPSPGPSPATSGVASSGLEISGSASRNGAGTPTRPSGSLQTMRTPSRGGVIGQANAETSSPAGALGPTYNPVRKAALPTQATVPIRPGMGSSTPSGLRTLSDNASTAAWSTPSRGGFDGASSFGVGATLSPTSGRGGAINGNTSFDGGHFGATPPPGTSGIPHAPMTFAEIQAQQQLLSSSSSFDSPFVSLSGTNAGAFTSSSSSHTHSRPSNHGSATTARSFAEIQAEERERDEAKREQEREKREFEKWWEEESRRVKAEEVAAVASASTATGSGGRGGGRSGKKGRKSGTSATSSNQARSKPPGQSTPSAPGSGPGSGSGSGGGRGNRIEENGAHGASDSTSTKKYKKKTSHPHPEQQQQQQQRQGQGQSRSDLSSALAPSDPPRGPRNHPTAAGGPGGPGGPALATSKGPTTPLSPPTSTATSTPTSTTSKGTSTGTSTLLQPTSLSATAKTFQPGGGGGGSSGGTSGSGGNVAKGKKGNDQ